MKFEYAGGATPLDLDEINGLIPSHIATQAELNEWEATNILKAENWLFSASRHRHFFTLDFIKLLHKKMFDVTWRWAGTFRHTLKNIGVEPAKITAELTNLLRDVEYQIQKETYPIDEIAYRFHHRLVAIHAFANGNGRHARLMTDYLLTQLGAPRFTWGEKRLISKNEIRKQYINALKDADKHDYKKLAGFVRT